MNIDLYKAGKTVAVLGPVGKVKFGAGDAALRRALNEAREGGSKSVVIDLAEALSLDPTGLDELVGAHATVTSRGGVFALAAPSQEVRDALLVPGDWNVLDVFDTVDEAVTNLERRGVGEL